MLYIADHPLGVVYDSSDGIHHYITDRGKIDKYFSGGGSIKIIFNSNGEPESAEWIKDSPRDFIDWFIAFPAIYPQK